MRSTLLPAAEGLYYTGQRQAFTVPVDVEWLSVVALVRADFGRLNRGE